MGFVYRARCYLLIDLSRERFEFIPLESGEVKPLCGGRALSLMLWDRWADYSMLGDRTDQANPIVFSLGAASDLDIVPFRGCVVTTRNPMNRKVSSFFIEGDFAQALYGIGVDAIVVIGRRSRTTCLKVNRRGVEFVLDDRLHNYTVSQLETRSQGDHVVALGPAGDLLLPYSAVVIDRRAVPGFPGVVFAKKNLKMMQFFSSKTERSGYFTPLKGESCKYLSSLTSPSLIEAAGKYGWLALSGFTDFTDGRLWAFEGCEDSALWAMGPNIGMFNPGNIAPLLETVTDLGVDPYAASLFLCTLKPLAARRIRALEQFASGGSVKIDRRFIHDSSALPPLDFRALPSTALLASLGYRTPVWPEFLHGPVKGDAKQVALALECQIMQSGMESAGIPWRLYSAGMQKKEEFIQTVCDLLSVSEGYEFSFEQFRALGEQTVAMEKELDRKSGYTPPRSLPLFFSTTPMHLDPAGRTLMLGRLLAFYDLRESSL